MVRADCSANDTDKDHGNGLLLLQGMFPLITSRTLQPTVIPHTTSVQSQTRSYDSHTIDPNIYLGALSLKCKPFAEHFLTWLHMLMKIKLSPSEQELRLQEEPYDLLPQLTDLPARMVWYCARHSGCAGAMQGLNTSFELGFGHCCERAMQVSAL